MFVCSTAIMLNKDICELLNKYYRYFGILWKLFGHLSFVMKFHLLKVHLHADLVLLADLYDKCIFLITFI